MGWTQLTFDQPWALVLLIPLAIYGYWFFLRGKRSSKGPALAYPIAPNSPFPANKLVGKIFQLRSVLFPLVLFFLILALANPGQISVEEKIEGEGIDIMVAFDLSSSMLAKDFEPDRLEVAKIILKEFIENRPLDRIGIAGFAGESFTHSPLTTDHQILLKLADELECGMVEDGTAIGMGLATALARMRHVEGESGLVILLTDGVNNTGYIDPLTAAQMAEKMGIRVYTIAVGSRGLARAPIDRRRDGTLVFGNVRVEIDEESLRQISEITGGQYFRADDEEALRAIYAQIDEMEKSEFYTTHIHHFDSWYRWPALFAVFLLLLYLIPDIVFRKFP